MNRLSATGLGVSCAALAMALLLPMRRAALIDPIILAQACLVARMVPGDQGMGARREGRLPSRPSPLA